jgi:hypothetical protein
MNSEKRETALLQQADVAFVTARQLLNVPDNKLNFRDK